MKSIKRVFVMLLLVLFVAIAIRLYKERRFEDSNSSFSFHLQKESNPFHITKNGIVSPFVLDDVFDGILNYDPDTDIKIAVLGDVMLGRTVNVKIIESKNNNWPFTNVKNKLQDYDLVFANLESPLTFNCKSTNTGMIFCGKSEYAKVLKENGITAVSLANNHSMNQGEKGLKETIDSLNSVGIAITGVNNPTIIKIEDVKVALLGFSDVECNPKYIECADEKNIIEDIKKAKENGAEQIIIMFHWGAEYTYTPNNKQVELGHMSIENGASLVLGNHPHWYQKIEVYKEKVIAYSHGNFVFDQMWSRQTQEGLIGEYILQLGRINDANFIPVKIENYGVVNFTTIEESARMLKHLRIISMSK